MNQPTNQPQPSPENWMTPQKVTRYVAEKIWEKFPFPQKRGSRIIWEYGFLETIVDAVLHPSEAPEISLQQKERFLQAEPEATVHVMTEARKLADSLATKRKAFALFLLGVADAPIPNNITKSGSMQKLAAEIYDLPEEEFARCMETARAAYTKEYRRIKDAEAGRLNSIKGAGAATRAHPIVAAKYPRVFEIIDEGLRKRKGPQ